MSKTQLDDEVSDRVGSGKLGDYVKILQLAFKRWTSIRGQLRDEKLNEEAEELILPSNEDWRQRVYYGLVELQRACDKETTTNRVAETELSLELEKTREKEEAQDDERKRKTMERSRVFSHWEWEPRILRSSSSKTDGETCKVDETEGSIFSRTYSGTGSRTGSGIGSRISVGRSMTEACAKPGWRVNDIVLAAKVLRKESKSLVYSDEAEMRRVFGLVYDVLRYKKIFCRALKEVGFWRFNDQLKQRRKIVWLLLYDLQGRKFSSRGEIDAVEEREKIFQNAGLKDIEAALLEAKTHLAASLSRQRIRGSALSLDELLPTRLRVIEGVAWGEQAEAAALASGWINSNKFTSKEEFHEEMSKLNLILCEDEGASELGDAGYMFDPICPKMIGLREEARETLARSSLVHDHRFVFLERSLCLGAAALAQAMRVGRFCGPVVLTHPLAPRHTGYLAELLQDIQDAGRLLAFGVGERLAEYETYLNELGVTSQRCRVFSEKYVSPPATAELDRATVVLAIPPCSYTGVRDIVDLAVARGGDAELLESLTDACVAVDDNDDDEVGREIEPPCAHLADQMTTLKYALTRPNVQFVLYEAHTVLPSETTEMIRRVVDYANRMAVARHVRDQPSKKKLQKEGGESRGELNADKLEHPDDERDDDRIFPNVVVPDSDLFEVGTIDDIYGKNISNVLDPGCFLAVIKRKEMMQFDSLFMIKVAESKGLFGDPNERERREKKREPVTTDQTGSSSHVNPRKRAKRRSDNKIELDRLIAHTHCSLMRTLNEHPVCPRQERLRAMYEKNNPWMVAAKGAPAGEKGTVSRVDCHRNKVTPADNLHYTNIRSETSLFKRKASNRTERIDHDHVLADYGLAGVAGHLFAVFGLFGS
nr:putative methyltransferase NSUN7 isoform X1 [Megalopta genalis]